MDACQICGHVFHERTSFCVARAATANRVDGGGQHNPTHDTPYMTALGILTLLVFMFELDDNWTLNLREASRALPLVHIRADFAHFACTLSVLHSWCSQLTLLFRGA